jgi:hypothetical protein
MSKRTIGIVLVIVGVIVLIVSLAADVIGIGNEAGIGWIQLLGAAVGVVVVLGGGWLALSKPGPKK